MADKTETKPLDMSFTIADPNHLPNDTIQVVKFCPTNSTILAAGCWDETVRLYQLAANMGQKAVVQQACVNVGAPVLDLVWYPNGQGMFIATGDPNANILFLSLGQSNPTPTPIGVHQGLVCLTFAQVQGFDLLMTAGLDRQLAFWMMNQGKWERKFNAILPKTPTCIDVDLISNFVLLGLECDIGIYMLEKLQKGDTSIQLIELLLKSPITCVRVRDKAQEPENFKPQERAMVACGADGRIWYGEIKMNNFSKTDIILFKAHSKKNQLFPVNGVGFSKLCHHSMYTVSSDGCIYFWDTVRKNKLTGYTVGDQMPITAADVSADQTLMAVAVGYDWSLGVWGTAKYKIRPKIFIHQMTQKDHKRDK